MKARGFSLMEVMLAVAIVGFITMILGGTLARQLETKEIIDAHAQVQNTARIALLRMAREISMAFLSKHYNCVERRTETVFQGKSGSRQALLFSAMAHYKWRRDAHEGDASEISYYIDTDPDDSKNKALFRRESRRITEEPGESGTQYVLAHDVKDLELRFFNPDTDRWEDEWDTTRSEKKFRLPLFVKIELTLEAPHNDKGLSFTTQTRIMLQDALMFGPNLCLN